MPKTRSKPKASKGKKPLKLLEALKGPAYCYGTGGTWWRIAVELGGPGVT